MKQTKEKIIEDCLLRVHFDGWEKGKEQVKTPYKYTLDDNIPRKEFRKILKLFSQQKQEIIEEIKKLPTGLFDSTYYKEDLIKKLN